MLVGKGEFGVYPFDGSFCGIERFIKSFNHSVNDLWGH